MTDKRRKELHKAMRHGISGVSVATISAEELCALLDKYDQLERAPVNAFLADIVAVCLKHEMTISHEDRHGSFGVEGVSQGNIDWLREARDWRGDE